MRDVLMSTTTADGELSVLLALTTETHESPAVCLASSTVYLYFTRWFVFLQLPLIPISYFSRRTTVVIMLGWLFRAWFSTAVTVLIPIHTGDKVEFNTVDFVESRQSRPCGFGPVHTGDKLDRIGNKVERIGNNVETSWILVNTAESKLKSRTQHERLRRRRFFAAATAIIVETDAKITSSFAILSKWMTSVVPGSSRDS